MVGQAAYETVVDDFAAWLAEENLELRNVEGTLYTYSDGAWGVMSSKELVQFERSLYEIALRNGFPYAEKRRQLWGMVVSRALPLDQNLLDDRVLLALPNGTLDPIKETISDHDPEDYTTRRIAIPYDPDADCPEWRKMLNRILAKKDDETKEQYISFLQEFMGMALCGFKPGTPRSLRKALVMLGGKGTAKTSVADVMREFFMTDEVCAENIDQLSKDFGAARLASARALIADDAIGVKSKVDPKVLKKIITGEPMSARRLYKDYQTFRFRGPVVFTTNVQPKITDETDALFDRTLLLKFDYYFTEEDKKELGKYGDVVRFLHAHEEFPGILNWSLLGMKRAKEMQRYTYIPEVAESGTAWRAESDPVFDFLHKFAVADKRCFCSVPLLARLITVFAIDEHHAARDEHSPKKNANRLVREVTTAVKGTSVLRMDRTDVIGNVILGIRINEEGMAWHARAQTGGLILPGVKWALNGKVL